MVIWPGGRERAHIPRLDGVTASLKQAADDIAMQWVAIDEMAEDARAPATPDFPALQLISIGVTVPISALVGNLPDAAPNEVPPNIASEGNSNTGIFGQYLGQINARIDRAWVRPKTAVGATSFLCQVRIEQDTAGNVKDVTLERCNGTLAWQQSLVNAIEVASPLPAPADPAAFRTQVRVAFHEDAPDGGASGTSLKKAAADKQVLGAANEAASLTALRRLRDARPQSGHAPVIDLRIAGRANQQDNRISTVEANSSALPIIDFHAEQMNANGTSEQRPSR